MRIYYRRIVLVSAALLASAGCARHNASPLTADYEIRIPPPSRGDDRVTVGLDVENVPADSIVVSGFADRRAMAIDTLVAWGPDGGILPVRARTEISGAHGNPIELPRFVIDGPLPAAVRIRYRVRLGRPEHSNEMVSTGRCYGVRTATYAAFVGRNVFLLPQAGELNSISVRFRLPPGWSVQAPWMKDGVRWRPGIHGRSAAEHLITATMGVGRFHERIVPFGRTRLHLVFPESLDVAARSVTSRLAEGASYLRTLLGRDLGRDYLLMALPRAPNGAEVIGEGWATGNGGTLLPLTASRLQGVAVGLAAAALRFAPFRTNELRSTEYWILDGVEQWYAARTLVSVMGHPGDVERMLATRYLGTFTGNGLDRNLEHLYDRPGGQITLRESLAPTLLACVDRDLADHGMAGQLDAVIQQLSSASNRRSFWELLPSASAFRAAASRDSLTRGLKPLPVEALYRPEPLRPEPTPLPSAAVDTLWLAYTGRNEGFLEICGCKVNQAGGVARRATAIRSFRRAHPHSLLIDAGDAYVLPQDRAPLDALERAEQGMVAQAMGELHYQGTALATTELSLGVGLLEALVREYQLPVLAANIAMPSAMLVRASVRLRVGRRSIRLIGAYDPPSLGRAPPICEEAAESLAIADPAASVRRELQGHTADELVIVAGRLSPDATRRLVESCPEIDLIVTSDVDTPAGLTIRGGRPYPDYDFPGFYRRTLVLSTRSTRFGIGTARLALDPHGRIAGAVLDDIRLTDSIPDDPVIRSRLTHFYDRVGREQTVQEAVPALFAWDATRQQGDFVGAKACSACHRPEYLQWLETPHADAYKTLLQKHRHFQPRCVSCHVVGYGTPHGYQMGSADERLANVGCEVCHGPGAAHARSPAGSNITRKVGERVCLECHTREHSDRFDFVARLPLVRHQEGLRPSMSGTKSQSSDVIGEVRR